MAFLTSALSIASWHEAPRSDYIQYYNLTLWTGSMPQPYASAAVVSPKWRRSLLFVLFIFLVGIVEGVDKIAWVSHLLSQSRVRDRGILTTEGSRLAACCVTLPNTLPTSPVPSPYLRQLPCEATNLLVS